MLSGQCVLLARRAAGGGDRRLGRTSSTMRAPEATSLRWPAWWEQPLAALPPRPCRPRRGFGWLPAMPARCGPGGAGRHRPPCRGLANTLALEHPELRPSWSMPMTRSRRRMAARRGDGRFGRDKARDARRTRPQGPAAAYAATSCSGGDAAGRDLPGHRRAGRRRPCHRPSGWPPGAPARSRCSAGPCIRSPASRPGSPSAATPATSPTRPALSGPAGQPGAGASARSGASSTSPGCWTTRCSTGRQRSGSPRAGAQGDGRGPAPGPAEPSSAARAFRAVLLLGRAAGLGGAGQPCRRQRCLDALAERRRAEGCRPSASPGVPGPRSVRRPGSAKRWRAAACADAAGCRAGRAAPCDGAARAGFRRAGRRLGPLSAAGSARCRRCFAEDGSGAGPQPDRGLPAPPRRVGTKACARPWPTLEDTPRAAPARPCPRHRRRHPGPAGRHAAGPDAPLRELGLELADDGRTAQRPGGVGLRDKLPATLVFDHPTCRDLAAISAARRSPNSCQRPPKRPTATGFDDLDTEDLAALLEQELDAAGAQLGGDVMNDAATGGCPAGANLPMRSRADARRCAPRLPARLQAERNAPIAVIGMACRFAGADDLDSASGRTCWPGRDAVRPVPADRWDADAWYRPGHRCAGPDRVPRGGFIDDVDGFDADLFGICRARGRQHGPAAAPAAGTGLACAGGCRRSAGPAAAAGRSACSLGMNSSDHLLSDAWRAGARSTRHMPWPAPSRSIGRRAARLSSLGLTGPALVVDTACSSSLVAAHLAVQACAPASATWRWSAAST